MLACRTDESIIGIKMPTLEIFDTNLRTGVEVFSALFN